MKHLFSTLFVVFFATSLMAQTGLSCEDPIPVDSNYQANVDGPCVLWYTAGTYDLPLHVYFLPDAENSTWGPEVEIDFTCEEGVYDDPNIANLVGSVSDLGYTLPIELLCDQVVREGKVAYDLSIGKFYRDQLTKYGINYNVKAFVKVRYSESGRITLRPDTAFRNCMDNAHYIVLGDTLDIIPDDTESVFVAALPDWQNDSIRFVWDGDEPVRMYFATTECNFIPSETNEYVYKYYDITSDAPLKMYSNQMKADIDNSKDGGIFYVKVVSSSTGKLIVEKIPLAPPAGNATRLEYNQSVTATSGNDLYAFFRTWRSATAFVADQPIEMEVSNSHLFDESQAYVFVNTYSSEFVDGKHTLALTTAEMLDLVERMLDNYIYVRFNVTSPTIITPMRWEFSECVDNTMILQANVPLMVSSSSSSNMYRLAYDDIKGADLKIKWAGSRRLNTYIGDTCIFAASSTDAHVIYEKAFPRAATITVDAATVASWANSVDEEGYLYVRFAPQTTNEVTFISEKPVTLDPIYTTDSAAVCFGENYDWNGKTYTETGKYTYTTVAANGADSIVTLNLTIYPKVPVTKDTAAICYGETYPWQGQEYTASGEYSVTLQDVNGCDSIVTLNLTVYPQTEATTETVEVPFGTTYEWNGLTYTESGEYTTTLQDENGCDYEATLILTILPEEKPEFAYPVVASSEESLLINYPLATQVYGMEYLSWQAGDVTLAWSGATPLYVFIAKVADFAVAVHHKNVVKFIEIPAEGSVVLPKSEVQALNRYATEEGYLYVRFLTEKEGVLTTAQAE